jgi:hypothetical protein
VLYRSIDFGTTWAPWGASTFRSPCDIVVVPDSAAIVQVADGTTGSGQGQIFRSTDGGVTWSLRWTNPFIGAGSEVPGLSCSRLRNGTTLATNWSTGGVERSTDFGSTWPVVANTNYSWGTDIAHDDPNVVMYGVFGGSRSFLSLDGGATFSNSDSTHLPNANYSLFLPDRGLMLAEQNNGLWKMDFTYAFTPGGAQGVTVTAPNGGESWAAGSVHSITWNAAAIALAHLEYRRSPADPWVAIADVEGYRGSYAWTIPANATTQAQVRVSDAWDAAPADLSNATFTITVTPALALLTPNGGETWPYGSQHAIRWTSVLVDSVALDLQATPGAAWTEIVPTFPAAGGSWTWTLPNLSTSVARVRVRQRGGALLDAGDGLFKITVPSWLASPDPIDFGPTLVGATNVTPIQLRNSGSGALTLTAVTSTNPDIHPGRTTLTIGPGAIDTLGIFYSPTAVGPDTSQVEITTNDPGSPHVIQVTGSGTTNTASGFGRPAVLALSPNHPNPFAGSTWIAYDLPVESDVALEVFDLHGHRVATLARGIEPAGQHRVRFGDPGDGTGERLAAGVYFVRLRVGPRSLTRKMLHVP